MRKVDREALQRAMRTVAADPAHKQWLKAKLKDEPWEQVAESAAYHCQVESLHLKPWQPLPMWAGDDRPRDDWPSAGRVAAWELRRRLLKAGLSEFEPNPVGACCRNAQRFLLTQLGEQALPSTKNEWRIRSP